MRVRRATEIVWEEANAGLVALTVFVDPVASAEIGLLSRHGIGITHPTIHNTRE